MPRSEDSIALMPAPYGSELYRASLKLRDEVLRQPLGLTLTAEELADDAFRTHFCAVADGAVVGSVSLRPVDQQTLQFKQMAVAQPRAAKATASSCSTPASAPTVSTPGSATVARASPSTRTPSRTSK